MRRFFLALALIAGCGDADNDGYSSGDGDCDDANPSVSPLSRETCNNLDDDCNGQIDDDPRDGESYYADEDGDGCGDPDEEVEACDEPDDYVDNRDDADDGDEDVCGGGDTLLADMSFEELQALCDQIDQFDASCDAYGFDYVYPDEFWLWCAEPDFTFPSSCEATGADAVTCMQAMGEILIEDACAFDPFPAECGPIERCFE